MKCTNNFIVNGIKVPCMMCKACRINKISTWTIRILGEMSKNPKSAFLTLTYDPENLQFEDNVATLRKRHLQLFFKRLRKEISKWEQRRIKYFACGEYGETFNRPHYHLIILGINIEELKAISAESIWGKGHIYYGTVTPSSIRYVLGYIMDKISPDYYEPAESPFQISSNLFGSEWIDENIELLCQQGYFTYRGKKIAIPKFIKEYYNIGAKSSGEMSEFIKNANKYSKTGLTGKDLYWHTLREEDKKVQHTEKTLDKKEVLKGQRQKF